MRLGHILFPSFMICVSFLLCLTTECLYGLYTAGLWSDRVTVYISSLSFYLIGMKRSLISGLDDLNQQFTQGFLMDHIQSRIHLFTRTLSFEVIPKQPISFV